MEFPINSVNYSVTYVFASFRSSQTFRLSTGRYRRLSSSWCWAKPLRKRSSRRRRAWPGGRGASMGSRERRTARNLTLRARRSFRRSRPFGARPSGAVRRPAAWRPAVGASPPTGSAPSNASQLCHLLRHFRRTGSASGALLHQAWLDLTSPHQSFLRVAKLNQT